jgi:Ni,Fe-hydrogenase III small subunit/Pyruvate/2-oxoacid:ferredoxin oxidoreductase delta subunit
MFKVISNRLEQGYRTTTYPKEPISLYSSFRGLPEINSQCEPTIVSQCAALCPQNAILVEKKKIDLGRCTFCGECAHVEDGAFVRFSQNFEMGTAHRDDLITSGSLPDLATHAKTHFKKLFGRSLQLRQVSAGGCNACEADTNVLNTPFFDLSRFGIDFVASPRHADGIHVTGPITVNMKAALLATYEAVPAPKVVIASGSCPISGGPFHGSSDIVGDLNSLIPVDLYIPGCPPHPLTTLHALLAFFK